MITTSLDWSAYETKLLNKTFPLEHGHDVRTMIYNIRPEITELSKAEVLLRRGLKHSTDRILLKVNNDIEIIEEFLTVAALLG